MIERYIRLFLELIDIRPAKGGAVVHSPLSGETTAAVLEHVIDEWKCMTTVTAKDCERMFDACTAADGPKTGSINNTRETSKKSIKS